MRWAGDSFRDVSPISSWDRLQHPPHDSERDKRSRQRRKIDLHYRTLQDMENLCRVFEDAVMVSSFPAHQVYRDQNKQATFEHLCLVSHPPVTQKGTRGERARTCECTVQEAEVVPRDRRQVLVCHAPLQSPSNRPTTSHFHRYQPFCLHDLLMTYYWGKIHCHGSHPSCLFSHIN